MNFLHASQMDIDGHPDGGTDACAAHTLGQVEHHPAKRELSLDHFFFKTLL